MSSNELHIGKLTPVVLEDGVTVEEFIKQKFSEQNTVFDDYYDSYAEQAYDVGYFVSKSGNLYEIDDEEHNPYGFEHSKKDSNGVIEYTVLFYNGGASLREVLDGIVEHEEER